MATPPTLLDAEDYRADDSTRDRNQDRHTDHHVNECWRCGRGLTVKAETNAWWVHMSAHNELVPTSGEPLSNDDDSLGHFPLGPECAKHISTTHRQQLP